MKNPAETHIPLIQEAVVIECKNSEHVWVRYKPLLSGWSKIECTVCGKVDID